MTQEHFERLQNRLMDVRNTDDLFDLELRLGPFDEEDPLGERALFQLAGARCQLSRGPALSAERFTLMRAAPACASARFEVRGRVGTRITRVVWADGELFGSLYVLRLLDGRGVDTTDAKTARALVHSVFDIVMEDVVPALAVA